MLDWPVDYSSELDPAGESCLPGDRSCPSITAGAWETLVHFTGTLISFYNIRIDLKQYNSSFYHIHKEDEELVMLKKFNMLCVCPPQVPTSQWPSVAQETYYLLPREQSPLPGHCQPSVDLRLPHPSLTYRLVSQMFCVPSLLIPLCDKGRTV